MFLGITYAVAGLDDKARDVAAEWEKIPGAALAPAWIYMNLGDHESALHWIAESEKIRVPWYPWMLADDPRLQARAAALGLPDPRDMGCSG
jgi:hypothetical protein